MDNNMVLNSGFNELVFENRHKEYGAYQIRRRYKRNVLLASLISISIFCSGMVLYFVNLPDAMAAELPDKQDGTMIIPYIIPPPTTVQPPVKPIQVTHPAGPKTPTMNPNLTTPVVTTTQTAAPTNHDAGGSPNGDPNSLANNND